MPGFNEKEIEVSVEPRRLTITGKRETETKKRRKEEQDGLFGILLEPDPANCGSACECGRRENHCNFEEWRAAVDHAKSCQSEDARDQVQGSVALVSGTGKPGTSGFTRPISIRLLESPRQEVTECRRLTICRLVTELLLLRHGCHSISIIPPISLIFNELGNSPYRDPRVGTAVALTTACSGSPFSERLIPSS